MTLVKRTCDMREHDCWSSVSRHAWFGQPVMSISIHGIIENDNTVMNLCGTDGILLTHSLGSDDFVAYLQG